MFGLVKVMHYDEVHDWVWLHGYVGFDSYILHFILKQKFKFNLKKKSKTIAFNNWLCILNKTYARSNNHSL